MGTASIMTTTVSCTLLRATTLKVEGKGSMTSLSSYALSWPGTSATPPALCMTSCMPFMKWPATTLVEQTVGAGKLIEMYSYTAAGAVTKKRLRVQRGAGTADKDFVYGYGSDGKLATVLYPGASVPFTYS